MKSIYPSLILHTAKLHAMLSQFSSDIMGHVLLQTANPSIFLISKEITKTIKDLCKSKNPRYILIYLFHKHGFHHTIQRRPKSLHHLIPLFFEYMKITNVKTSVYEWSTILIYAMRFKLYDITRNLLQKAINQHEQLPLNITESALYESLPSNVTPPPRDLWSTYYPLQIAAMDDNYSMADLKLFIAAGSDLNFMFTETMCDMSIQDQDKVAILDKLVLLGADVNHPQAIQHIYIEGQKSACKHLNYLLKKGANPTLLVNALLDIKPMFEGEMSLLLRAGADINYNNGQWLMTYVVDPWDSILAMKGATGHTPILRQLIKNHGLDVNILDGKALQIATSMYLQVGSSIPKYKTNSLMFNEEDDRSVLFLSTLQILLEFSSSEIKQKVHVHLQSLKLFRMSEKINRDIMLCIFKHH